MENIEFRPAVSAREVLEGRLLQANAYVAAGFTEPCEDGLITDEWVPTSTYFVAAAASSIVGVARTIHAEDPADLPVLRHLAVEAAWRGRLESLPGAQVVEISALAVDNKCRKQSRSITAGLYRCMYQRSLSNTEHRWWLAMADARLYRTLTSVFSFNFQPIGDSQFYKGGDCVPCALDLHAAPLHLQLVAPELLAWFMDGLDLRYWPSLQKVDPVPV